MSDDTRGFVPLHAVTGKARRPEEIVADIRRIYFRTTKRTIQNDVIAAIALLKSLPTEEDRERARVYMDGLAQMRSDWARADDGGKGVPRKRRRR
jgi:hypothetical protein